MSNYARNGNTLMMLDTTSWINVSLFEDDIFALLTVMPVSLRVMCLPHGYKTTPYFTDF